MAATLQPVEGLTKVSSPVGHSATLTRVLESLEQRGVPLVALIDHAAAARATGLALPPTELLIFGNARVGTPLMCAERSVAIDLPLKLLLYEDRDGGAVLTYNDPAWIARRHKLSQDDSNLAILAMQEVIAAIVRDATAPACQ